MTKTYTSTKDKAKVIRSALRDEYGYKNVSVTTDTSTGFISVKVQTGEKPHAGECEDDQSEAYRMNKVCRKCNEMWREMKQEVKEKTMKSLKDNEMEADRFNVRSGYPGHTATKILYSVSFNK